MRLLAVEASQNGGHCRSRYQQVIELGAELCVLNGLGEAGFWPDPRYRMAGSKKIGDIVDAARRWHQAVPFDGVLTFAESAIIATAAVAEALGLPGIGVPAARASRNKVLMHRAHQRAGAPVARFRYTPRLADALSAAAGFGYPVVVKPALGAASNFVFRADSAADLRRCYAAAAAGARLADWTGFSWSTRRVWRRICSAEMPSFLSTSMATPLGGSRSHHRPELLAGSNRRQVDRI